MIFLTGATGFLGKNILNHLVKQNISICALSRKKQYGAILWRKADLTDRYLPCDLLSGCKTIIHSAGLLKGSYKELDAVNYQGTQKLIALAKKNSVNRFIFISSIDVLLFNTAYAQSKRKAEEAVMNSGLDWVIIRPSVIFGQNDKKNFAWLNMLIRTLPILPLPYGGSFSWEPVYLEDLTRLIIEFALSDSESKRTLNVVGPEVLSFREIVSILESFNNIKRLKINLSPFSMKLIYNAYKMIRGLDAASDFFASFQQKIVSNSFNGTLRMPTRLAIFYSKY